MEVSEFNFNKGNKLGTYLVLRRVWNSNDCQGHRSKVKVTG
jgi:hypothetical protein